MRTTRTASSPLNPAFRSVPSACSMGRSVAAESTGRLTTTIVDRGQSRAFRQNARARARICSSQLVPGSVVKSMPDRTCSATPSSSAALLGT